MRASAPRRKDPYKLARFVHGPACVQAHGAQEPDVSRAQRIQAHTIRLSPTAEASHARSQLMQVVMRAGLAAPTVTVQSIRERRSHIASRAVLPACMLAAELHSEEVSVSRGVLAGLQINRQGVGHHQPTRGRAPRVAPQDVGRLPRRGHGRVLRQRVGARCS